jgi:hypothetical protein
MIVEKYKKVLNFLKENGILIDNSGFKGDKTKNSILKRVDFFFDVESKKLENILNEFPILVNETIQLEYPYRNLEGKPEFENKKLARIIFK